MREVVAGLGAVRGDGMGGIEKFRFYRLRSIAIAYVRFHEIGNSDFPIYRNRVLGFPQN